MAVPKDKVVLALGLKYKGKNISKTLVNDLATDWAENIEDDAGIDDYINTHDSLINHFMKEADRRATTAAQKAKQDALDKLADKPKDEQAPTDLPPDTPPYVAAIMKRMEEIAGTVTTLQTTNAAKTIQEQLKTEARLKNVPDFVKELVLPTLTAENFEATVTGLVEKYTQFATDNKLSMIGNDAPSGNGVIPGKVNGKVQEASKEEVDAVMSQL